MNGLLKELSKLFGAGFTWIEQPSSYCITYETQSSIISKMWIAEQWVEQTPLKCVSVALSQDSLSLIFEKPEIKKEAA